MRFVRFTSLPPTRLACIGVAVPVLAISVLTVASGCLTAQPPDLPEISHRPTIVADEVPSTYAPLVEWPTDRTFIVHVQADPGTFFIWAAFFDYNPSVATAPSNPFVNPFSLITTPKAASFDGVPVEVSFQLSPEMIETTMADGLCHRIDLVVATAFAQSGIVNSPAYFYTPSPTMSMGGDLGGDVVTWWYTGGLDLASCSPYGGALPDGGYPAPDAPSDGPPLVPE